jgi:hypothetical protein
VARRGEERHTRAVAVDHVASARRTQRRVVSDGGEIGRQATVLGRGVARRCVSAVGSVVAVKHAAAVRAQRQFMSGFENGCGRSGDSRESD